MGYVNDDIIAVIYLFIFSSLFIYTVYADIHTKLPNGIECTNASQSFEMYFNICFAYLVKDNEWDWTETKTGTETRTLKWSGLAFVCYFILFDYQAISVQRQCLTACPVCIRNCSFKVQTFVCIDILKDVNCNFTIILLNHFRFHGY